MQHEMTKQITSQARDLSFLEQVKKTTAGKNVLNCIQCGVCAGSCHARFAMDYSPMQVVKMVHLGLKNDVLRSSTIWICASCYTCTSRCPQGIDIPLLMSALKNMAIDQKIPAKIPAKPKFHAAFTEIVGKYGRMHEPQLQVRLLNKKSPKQLYRNALFGLKLWRKGKVRISPSKIQQKTGLDAIFENALRKEETQK